MGKLGGMNANDFAQLISGQIKSAKEGAEPQAKRAGEQVGESFADGIEQGFEDAASRITASSVKINKAFRDLAKRITEQKILLDGGNIVIDFSKVDIDSADFQKRINEIFKEIKSNSEIKFDSKTAEKHFKNMLGLYVKYTDKLSVLNEQFYNPNLKASTKKHNAQAQLAIMDMLDTIQKEIDAATGKQIELPVVLREDPKILRNTISTIDGIIKAEEKVAKQHDTNAEKIRKENKELKERNKILEEKVGPLEEGELPPARKPRGKKPKVETPALTEAGDGVIHEDQNKILEERNRLVNEYVAALKRVREIESRYSKPADMSKEDLTTWSDSHEIMRGMSVRTDYDDIKKGVAEKIGAEMTTFTKQYDSLAKEFGYSEQLFSGYNNLLIQIQQGALNATEAVAKLREEMSKQSPAPEEEARLQEEACKAAEARRAEEERLAKEREEAFNAEMEAAVAAEVEEELKAEQTQLNLAKEELKVEKEITAEKEKQYGYHAGKFRDDGYRAEPLWQSTPGRSTGFYGTGTYLTDSTHLNEISTGQYGRRPLSVIDPDMYNLFDATNDKTASQLHEFLKHITNKAFGGKGENIKSLYAEFKKIFPEEQIITYEDFKALAGELQGYVKDNFDNYSKSRLMDSVSTKFMKNFGYEGVDTRGTRFADTTYGTVIYDLKEESIILKEITDEMQKQEIIAGNIASIIEGRTNVQKKNKFTSAINGKSGKFKVKKPDAYSAMSREDATDYIASNYDYKLWNKWYSQSNDEARTQISQILENDIKMRNAALNQMWDEYKHLTGEDIDYKDFLYKEIPMYRGEPLNSQSESERALSLTLDPQAAEDFGNNVLKVWLRPIDTLGMANPTDMHQPEAEVMVLKSLVPEYDDWHNSLMTPPQVEEEVQVKTKLAETNEKVAESQKKVNEATKGVQMTIDDIVPSSAEETTPKVEEEAKALDKVGAAAEKAAKSKKKFAGANKEVAASVTPSVDRLETEADAIEDVGKAAKKTNRVISEEVKSAAESMSFSTRDYERLYDEMEAFAEQRKAENGYDLSKVSVNTDAHGNPLGATISYYKKATKETITETFKIDKAAQEAGDSVNRLVLSSRKATAGIADFEKATLQAINRQDQLIAQKNKTVSSLSAVLDPNSNRSLAGTDYEEEANRRIQAIKDEVAKLDQVDSAGERIILPEKDFLAIKRRIAELTQEARDFINASKNAEYAPTQLESHSVSSGNKYRADQLKAQIEDWKRAGIYVGDLKTKADELAQSVINITKHEDLKKYLEGMKEARALAKLATQDKKAEEERQKALNKEYEEYIKLIAKRDAIESKMIGLDAVKNKDELAALRADYDAVDNELNDKYGNFLSRKDVQERFSIGELASTDDAARRKMAVKEGQISDKKRLEEEAAAQQKVNEAYREYIRLVQERGRASVKLAGLDPEKNKAEIDNLTTYIDGIDEKLNETYGGLLSNHIAQATLTLEDFMKYYDKWQQKLAEKEAKAADKARNKEEAPYLNYGKTTANSATRKLDATEGAVEALGVTSPEVLAKLDAYKNKVKEVQDVRDKFAKDPTAAKDTTLVKQFQKSAYEAEQLRRGIKAVIDEEQKMIQMSEEQGFSPVSLTVDQMANLETEMRELAATNVQGKVEIKGLNDAHTQMYYTVTNSKGVVEEMTVALGQGTNTLYKYRTATKETGTLMQQVFKGIKVKAKELLSFVIGGGSVYKVIELLRQGIQYVREIDLALTELKKVTDETEESYDRFLETAAKTGARLGSTISAVTEATATFAKLGYSMEQATEMAEAAIVYKNVGDNIASTEDAADSIISTMKGFKLEATESMKIVDRFNEVGNRFAITSQGIGEALRLSASALSEGGNSLDESIGLITAANEVVNDPSSVGKNKLADIKSGYISQNPEVDKT